jgi:hypothetical protein
VSLSTEGGDLLLGFLTANETERLGCGVDGYAEVACHPWFASIDWTALVRQQLAPPLVPSAATAAQSEGAEAADADANDDADAAPSAAPKAEEEEAPEAGSATHELKEVDAFLSSQNERDAPYDEQLWKTAFGLFGPTVVNARLPSGADEQGSADADADAPPRVKHLADVKDLESITQMQDVDELKKALHLASEKTTQQARRPAVDETVKTGLKGEQITCADKLAAEGCGTPRDEPATREQRRGNLFGGAKPGGAKLVAKPTPLPDGALAGADHLSFEVVEAANHECAVDVADKVSRRVSEAPSEECGHPGRGIEETPTTVMERV